MSLPDIEDIAGRPVRHQQERCVRDFEKRPVLPDKEPFVIKHPNAYMRGHNRIAPRGSDAK